jgi:hypothetical protein
MVEITCDQCGMVKRPNTEKRNGHSDWLQGYDLISESPTSVQHSIRFLERWDDRRIAEFGAIHFCSVDCRDKYMKKAKVA